MSHLIFAISVNAFKEQINIAYEADNCEDEKKEHVSEVNLTFECILTLKEQAVSRWAKEDVILAADTSFLFCEHTCTFSGRQRGGGFGGSTSEATFKAGG